MMKLALLRNPVCHLGNAISRSSPRQTRTLRTAPVVMRKAQPSGAEDRNLPATTERGGAGSSLGFPGLGLASPFASRFREMEQEMENMMRSFGMSLAPLADESAFLPRNAMSLAVDVQDLGNSYMISADVPGMKKDEVKVEISPDRVLTVTGERKSEKKEEGEHGWVRMERSYGSFARSFRLPDNVDSSGIKAEMKHGVLQLTVPKKEGEETKKQSIHIDVGGE